MSKRKRRKRNYAIYEGIRCAVTLTFISGYVNAFTYVTQRERFAGVQTGNLLCFGINLAKGDWSRSFDFLLPIIVFMLGQSFTYLTHVWSNKHNYHWYRIASRVLLGVATVAVIITPFVPDYYTIICLAFFASVQVDTFKTLRGANYASVMMTGNVKNAAYLLTKGYVEKNRELQLIGHNTFLVLISFVLGVFCSTTLSLHFGEWALAGMLIPLVYLKALLREDYDFDQA